jgi:hypothetical protein
MDSIIYLLLERYEVTNDEIISRLKEVSKSKMVF